MERLLNEVAEAYRREIVLDGRQAQFLVLLAFVLTFLSTRSITHTIRRTDGQLLRNLHIRGVHVHHLVPGILLLLVTGYLGVTSNAATNVVAVLFGIGAALTLDEFALWLHLDDVYWSPRGRASVHVVIGSTALLLLLLLHLNFWTRTVHAVGRLVGLV